MNKEPSVASRGLKAVAIAVAFVAFVAVVMTFGLARNTPTATAPGAVRDAEPATPQPPTPTTAETHAAGAVPEEAVRRYVRENVYFPESTVFESWGPHDLAGEIAAAAKEEKPFQIVRAVYRTKDRQGVMTRHDALFFVLGGEIERVRTNSLGDNWLRVLKKDAAELGKFGDEVSKSVRGVKPDVRRRKP